VYTFWRSSGWARNKPCYNSWRCRRYRPSAVGSRRRAPVKCGCLRPHRGYNGSRGRPCGWRTHAWSHTGAHRHRRSTIESCPGWDGCVKACNPCSPTMIGRGRVPRHSVWGRRVDPLGGSSRKSSSSSELSSSFDESICEPLWSFWPPSPCSKLRSEGSSNKICYLSRAPALGRTDWKGTQPHPKKTSREIYTRPEETSRHLTPLWRGLCPRKMHFLERKSSLPLLFGRKLGQHAQPKTRKKV
jgi:hypothetical protein